MPDREITMTSADIIVIAVVALIIAGAIAYIVRAKKKGQKCIGCPYAKNCGKADCSCGSKDK